MKPIKLLIADVDGTLVTQKKEFTPRTLNAIQQLRASGIKFAITSGRPPRGMAMLMKSLNLDTPVAAFNGGMLMKSNLSAVLEQKTLPAPVACEVVDYLLSKGLDVWVYQGSDWFIRRIDAPHVATEASTVQFKPVVIKEPDKGLHDVLHDAIKIVGVSDDYDLVARCESELRGRVGMYVTAARSQPYYLDVTHPDANKGMVVQYIAQKLGIPFEEVAVIGDGSNDVLMFAIAGMSIAMGNASPEVQRTARYVTTSNENEGFANAVENFLLTKPLHIQANLGLPPLTRACLFDLDGVLTQTAKLHDAAWKQMFDAYLRERSIKTGEAFVPFNPHDYLQYVDGKPRLDGLRSFLTSRNIHPPEEIIRDLADRKDKIVVELFQQKHVETYEGSVRYVQAVHNAGIKTAVVTSSKHCEQVLESAGIANLFDARIDGNVAAEKHLHGKPAPDTYLAAAHALGVEPAQAVVFEDALSGVEAGRAGHFGYVVGVDRTGEQNGQREELRHHGADVVVDDLSSLLAAA